MAYKLQGLYYHLEFAQKDLGSIIIILVLGFAEVFSLSMWNDIFSYFLKKRVTFLSNVCSKDAYLHTTNFGPHNCWVRNSLYNTKLKSLQSRVMYFNWIYIKKIRKMVFDLICNYVLTIKESRLRVTLKSILLCQILPTQNTYIRFF